MATSSGAHAGRTSYTPPHERTSPFAQYAPAASREPPSRFSVDTPTPTAGTPKPNSRFSVDTVDTAALSWESHSSGASRLAPSASAPTSSGTQLEGDGGEEDDGGAVPEPRCPVIMTQEVDEDMLRTSLEDRIAYLTDFLGFTSRDAEVITRVAPMVHGLIPTLVDGMYEKLFEFDVTKRVFMSRNQGFDGPLPQKLEDLTLDSPQITFRKVFMKSWARRVLTADYSKSGTWAYMDKVGIMHTGVSPFKHQRTMGIAPLNVPYRDCALTLGWITQVLQTGILQLTETQLSTGEKIEACAAINKVIWIQNDLFSRHYIQE